MRTIRPIAVSFVVLIFATVFVAAQAVPDQIRMTTPNAPWTIVIDGKKLEIRDVQTKPDEKSAYFLLYDGAGDITVSFFIEPADKCRSSEECRDYVLNLGNPAWGKFQDLAKGKIADFSYFEFFRPEVLGQPLRMFDVYAQYVANGYWVDLHISKPQYKKEDRVTFENLIKVVNFVSKTATPTDGVDQLLGKIEKTTANWLQLWDAAKCRESYVALSSMSRAAVGETDWVPYCETTHKALGKPKSRKLILISFIKSLRGKGADHSGAKLGYQSVFEKGNVLEVVPLTLEKNGNWTVSSYLPQFGK